MDEYYIRSSNEQRTIQSAYNNYKGLSNYHHGVQDLTEEYLDRVMPPFDSDKARLVIKDILNGTRI